MKIRDLGQRGSRCGAAAVESCPPGLVHVSPALAVPTVVWRSTDLLQAVMLGLYQSPRPLLVQDQQGGGHLVQMTALSGCSAWHGSGGCQQHHCHVLSERARAEAWPFTFPVPLTGAGVLLRGESLSILSTVSFSLCCILCCFSGRAL